MFLVLAIPLIASSVLACDGLPASTGRQKRGGQVTSLDDTLAQLRETIAADGRATFVADGETFDIAYRPVEFASCKASWRQETIQQGSVKDASIRTVALADIDPNRVQVEKVPPDDPEIRGDYYRVKLSTQQGRLTTSDKESYGTVMDRETVILFADSGIADRAAKAFADAASLCASQPGR